MDRNGLWVSLILQLFIAGLGIYKFFEGREEDEMLKMVLGGVGGVLMLIMAFLTVKKLRELY